MTRSFEDAKGMSKKKRYFNISNQNRHLYLYMTLYEFIWHLQTLLPHFFRVYFQIFCYVMPLSEAGGYSGWWRVSAGFTHEPSHVSPTPWAEFWWFQCPNLILKLVKEFRRSNVCVTLVRNLQFQYMLFWMQDVKVCNKKMPKSKPRVREMLLVHIDVYFCGIGDALPRAHNMTTKLDTNNCICFAMKATKEV